MGLLAPLRRGFFLAFSSFVRRSVQEIGIEPDGSHPTSNTELFKPVSVVREYGSFWLDLPS